MLSRIQSNYIFIVIISSLLWKSRNYNFKFITLILDFKKNEKFYIHKGLPGILVLSFSFPRKEKL